MGNVSSSSSGSSESCGRPSYDDDNSTYPSRTLLLHVYVSKGGTRCYHAGIEVFGTEWAFGANGELPSHVCGIYPSRPKTDTDNFRYDGTVVLGKLPEGTPKSSIFAILTKMRSSWLLAHYDVLSHNCIHFAHAFCDAIVSAFPGMTLGSLPRSLMDPVDAGRLVAGSAPLILSAFHPALGAVAAFATDVVRSAQNDAGSCQNFSGSRGHRTSLAIPTRKQLEAMSVWGVQKRMWWFGVWWDDCDGKGDMIEKLMEHLVHH
ncbi:hypothetical protein DQ04_00901170 [Trypanosoma grayi]|uniref:hypothetical protein n=1 Tax=Trypanosoma grayi TaxID=71804 RepID=UPI0004F4007D|nr:hypothetical protein DQ04_00901170 [Trypanosoma grayi]KEG13615.1 hypothetical protein DQ04_00901170 [Trypanosoma grayi]